MQHIDWYNWQIWKSQSKQARRTIYCITLKTKEKQIELFICHIREEHFSASLLSSCSPSPGVWPRNGCRTADKTKFRCGERWEFCGINDFCLKCVPPAEVNPDIERSCKTLAKFELFQTTAQLILIITHNTYKCSSNNFLHCLFQ